MRFCPHTPQNTDSMLSNKLIEVNMLRFVTPIAILVTDRVCSL